MKKNFMFALLVSLSILHVHAQTTFIDRGKIYFERRINQFALEESLREEGNVNTFMEEVRKLVPKVLVNQYELVFNPLQSLYKIGENDTERKVLMQQLKPDDADYTYTNRTEGNQVRSFTLFDQYIWKENIKAIRWKFTGETREIAGFECKKALTTICDSVVVVAFYTDEITVSGGPDRFQGLPGMILGIAVPRLYFTLFATRIELGEPVIKSPVKTNTKFTDPGKLAADLEKFSYMNARMKQMTRWMQAL
jgi:GLPGLI family protein